MIRSRCFVTPAGVFVRECFDSSRLQGVPCSRVQSRTVNRSSLMNQLKKAGAVLATAALGMSTQVHAALPAGISTAIEGVEADGLTLVGLVAAAGAAVYLIAKVLARFGFKL